MLNTYVVEGGVGKCTAFTALVPKLKKISDVQIHTPYIHAFAGNPNVKMAYEATINLQDPRIQASDNIYYSEPYKSNFQFGKEHIIESYCREHKVEYDPKMVPKLYTEGHGKSVKVGYLFKKNLFGKVIGQALESSDDDSGLIKCMIRKM